MVDDQQGTPGPDDQQQPPPPPQGFTGSGAPDDVHEVDEEPVVDESTEEVPEHPEPTPMGIVHQDSVSEPGVTTTTNRLTGEEQVHDSLSPTGDPADRPKPDAEDDEAEPDTDDDTGA